MIERLASLEDRVLNVLRRGLDLDVDVETDVINSGLVDSLSFVDLLLELEEEFSIEIELTELDVDDFRDARTIAGFLGRSYDID